MATTTNVTIRMDSQLKTQAEALFSELGLNLSTAFGIFVRQAVREGRIPFELSDDDYLEDIIRDIREGRTHFSEHELIEVE